MCCGRHVDGDPGELFQATIALYNLGEDLGHAGSMSSLNETENRILARAYLQRHYPL